MQVLTNRNIKNQESIMPLQLEIPDLNGEDISFYRTSFKENTIDFREFKSKL